LENVEFSSPFVFDPFSSTKLGDPQFLGTVADGGYLKLINAVSKSRFLPLNVHGSSQLDIVNSYLAETVTMGGRGKNTDKNIVNMYGGFLGSVRGGMNRTYQGMGLTINAHTSQIYGIVETLGKGAYLDINWTSASHWKLQSGDDIRGMLRDESSLSLLTVNNSTIEFDGLYIDPATGNPIYHTL